MYGFDVRFTFRNRLQSHVAVLLGQAGSTLGAQQFQCGNNACTHIGCIAGQVSSAAGNCICCAAHLGGVLAAYTTLPVIGVPMATSVMGGMDSLLSIVQMPKGIPVATVAIDGADNAAILAAQMIALSDDALAQKLAQFKADMAAEVTAKDEKVRAQFA